MAREDKMLKSLTVALALGAAPAMAATLGDDGLHKAPWIIDTFKDLREDLTEADAEGKRLMVIIEQRGCIYCSKMHEEVFVLPVIEKAPSRLKSRQSSPERYSAIV